MLDGLGRKIDYLRISVTDRCDLRCVYCMPEAGVEPMRHADILRYEDMLRLTAIFASMGIKKVRLTGGEPLVRRGLAAFVGELKRIPGIERVVMTTNGMQLEAQLPALVSAGLDGVNISLDAIDEDVFEAITRRGGVERVLRAVDAACAQPQLAVKLNCVPTPTNEGQLKRLADFAAQRGIPLRFIELMPIGEGSAQAGLTEARVQAILGDMRPLATSDANDKCSYYELASGGVVGFISPLSHKFCSGCNRIRLTADGFLKTCLQYDYGVALKPLLMEDDAAIRAAIARAMENKPAGHHFGGAAEGDDETRKMSQIGG